MARPKQFDDDEVRERIANVFAAHGYQGTSIAMLTDACGLGKQSLYNAFGDKQALYLQSLQCSTERLSMMSQVLAQAATGRAAVDAFFEHMLAACADPDPARHRCIVSAGLLEDIDDATVVERLRQAWTATESLLRGAVQRGQRDGSIRDDRSALELARFLMTLMSGLRVTAKAVDSTRTLRGLVAFGLHMLDPPV